MPIAQRLSTINMYFAQPKSTVHPSESPWHLSSRQWQRNSNHLDLLVRHLSTLLSWSPMQRKKENREWHKGFSLPQPESDISIYISLNKFNIRSNEYSLASSSDGREGGCRILGVLVMDNLTLCMVKMTVVPSGSTYASQRWKTERRERERTKMLLPASIYFLFGEAHYY